MECNIGVLKNLAKFTAKFMRTAASGIRENRPCLAGCKIFWCFAEVTVSQYLRYWAFSLMQFSTDLALMNTKPQRIKVDDATRTNDNRGISWCPNSCKGKLLNLVSLANLFEMLYSRLITLGIMSQGHGSNSQGLHTSVAGKLLVRKLTESKTFYIFTFFFEIQNRCLGSSNFSWSLKN